MASMPERRPCECGCSPNTFSDGEAANDLKRYLENGPDATTRALLDAIVAEGLDGRTVLDIGGGIGAIQLELMAAGAAQVVAVDASEAYIETSEPRLSDAASPNARRLDSVTSSSWPRPSNRRISSRSIASCAATRTSTRCSGRRPTGRRASSGSSTRATSGGTGPSGG